MNQAANANSIRNKRENRHQPHPLLDIQHDERINNMRLTCPYCGHFTRVRNSEWISEKLVQGTVECQEPRCEWSGHFNFEITETTRPCAYSALAKIDLGIPLSPFLQRQLEKRTRQSKHNDLFTAPEKSAHRPLVH